MSKERRFLLSERCWRYQVLRSTDIDSELYMDRSEVYSRKYEVSRKYKNDKSKIYKICSIPNLSRMSIFNDLID